MAAWNNGARRFVFIWPFQRRRKFTAGDRKTRRCIYTCRIYMFTACAETTGRKGTPVEQERRDRIMYGPSFICARNRIVRLTRSFVRIRCNDNARLPKNFDRSTVSLFFPVCFEKEIIFFFFLRGFLIHIYFHF